MQNSEIQAYIEQARSQGASNDAIKKVLVQVGWSEADVDAALMPAAPIGPSLPNPPVPKSRGFGMWVAFEYALLFISLLVCAIALAGIGHAWVNEYFADSIRASYWYSYLGGIMQYYLAALIVAFPIFAALFFVTNRQVLRDPAIKNLKLRKTLVYLALIWTFIALITRVIRLVYGFLGGTATMNSLMHLLVTLLISGSIFLYFIIQVREDRK